MDVISQDNDYRHEMLSAALREAWAIGKSVEIFGNGESNSAKIIQLVEEGSGRRKIAKSIICEIDRSALSGRHDSPFTLRVSSGDATYIFVCELVDIATHNCNFLIGGEINRLDNRSFSRTKLRDDGLSVVTISDGSSTFPGFLKYLDFSSRSFGVEITTRVRMTEDRSYSVSGITDQPGVLLPPTIFNLS